MTRAAIDLLAVSEYESVQMRDVAEQAGTSLATLYRYFSSKEHLYAEALLAWSADFPRAGVRGATDEARLRALLRRAVRAFERSPQMFRAQMVIETSSDPNAREAYGAFATRITSTLVSALERVDPAVVGSVVTTVNCVLANQLRTWAQGRCSIHDVDRAVEGTIDLIFGPPPEQARGPTRPG